MRNLVMDVSHPMKGNEICKSVYLNQFVSKKPQKILEAAAAIFAIAQEDSNSQRFKPNKISWLCFIY